VVRALASLRSLLPGPGHTAVSRAQQPSPDRPEVTRPAPPVTRIGAPAGRSRPPGRRRRGRTVSRAASSAGRRDPALPAHAPRAD